MSRAPRLKTVAGLEVAAEQSAPPAFTRTEPDGIDVDIAVSRLRALLELCWCAAVGVRGSVVPGESIAVAIGMAQEQVDIIDPLKD